MIPSWNNLPRQHQATILLVLAASAILYSCGGTYTPPDTPTSGAVTSPDVTLETTSSTEATASAGDNDGATQTASPEVTHPPAATITQPQETTTPPWITDPEGTDAFPSSPTDESETQLPSEGTSTHHATSEPTVAATHIPTSTPVQVCYVDQDQDGYGADIAANSDDGESTDCGSSPGESSVGGDCDDASPDNFPGAEELCDETDNDCDSIIDETSGIGHLDYVPDLVLDSDALDVDLLSLAGSPTGPVTLTVLVERCVYVTSSTSEAPAMVIWGFPSGSSITLVNLGVIHGRGGDGAKPNSAEPQEGKGHDGGDAIYSDAILRIDNDDGWIFGGGGGGGSGDDPAGGGGGAGGGVGAYFSDTYDDSFGECGGEGSSDVGKVRGGCGADFDGSAGHGGRSGNPPEPGGGGSGGGAYGQSLDGPHGGPGGGGGGWGGGGGGGTWCCSENDRNAGPGGNAGFAIRQVGGEIIWAGGDDLTRVKGQVGE